jgi:hypothetical protein
LYILYPRISTLVIFFISYYHYHFHDYCLAVAQSVASNQADYSSHDVETGGSLMHSFSYARGCLIIVRQVNVTVTAEKSRQIIPKSYNTLRSCPDIPLFVLRRDSTPDPDDVRTSSQGILQGVRQDLQPMEESGQVFTYKTLELFNFGSEAARALYIR